MLQTHPGEEVGIAVVAGVVVGEGHQHHVDDGQDGEGQDAHQRQGQQGLVELIVQKGLHILLAAADLLTLGGDVHADAALLDLETPGVDEADDEDDGQKAVEHDLDRIVTGDPYVGIVDGIVLEAALDRTHGVADLKPVALVQPVEAGTQGVAADRNKHKEDEYDLEQQKQHTAQELSVEEIAEAEDEEGELHRPVALGEGVADVLELTRDGQTAVLEEIQDAAAELAKPQRDGAEEQLQVVEKRLEFIELQVLKRAESFHSLIKPRLCELLCRIKGHREPIYKTPLVYAYRLQCPLCVRRGGGLPISFGSV